jgi:hypothetical protein
MPRIALSLTAAGLLIGLMAPAKAQVMAQVMAQATAQATDPDAPRRPRITVHPRSTHPGPHAKRYCRSWLAREYRVSGPVIVPRMQCWWH